MDDIFRGYNWSGVTVLNAQHLSANEENLWYEDSVSTNFYQLGAKFIGETHVSYDGKNYLYDAGTLLYLPKETRCDIPYRRHIVSRGVGVCIFFDTDQQLFSRPTVIPIANRPQIRELFNKVADCYLLEDHIACMEAFYSLLMSMREEYSNLVGSDSARNKTAPAIEYISQHLCDPYIDITRLADLCGLSSEYFRHCFKREQGVAPHRYVAHQKILLARKLLCDESYTVDELSRRLGFSSCGYFTRFFRKKCGMTPTEYRKLVIS